MSKYRNIRGNEDGAALVIVILILLALTGIVMGVSRISVNETQLASNEMLDKQAFYLAEAGAEMSIRHLSELSTPFLGSGANKDQPLLLLDNVDVYDRGTITSYLDPLDSNTGNPSRFVGVTVRATLEGTGLTKVLQVKVGQQNFSRYAYFSDMETNGGYTIWFVTQDELHGPVHTNDQFHICGSPKFFEEVSSSASSVDYYHGGPPADDPQFMMGLTLDASTIPLPVNTDMLYLEAAKPGGLRLTGTPVTIRFRTDGSGNPYLSVTINGTTTTRQYPTNGVIYVTGDAEVEGTIRGQVTVGCDGDIDVIDNLVYYTDPRIDPTSTDLCGLVAEGNVWISDDTANLDSADETIMAAIMALNTSWGAEDYGDHSPRGKLNVYGGIIQRQRGPVGTFGAGGIRTGYEKNYVYDPRLMDSPPPAFPTTGQVEKIAWNEIDSATDISLNFW